jgi:GT2 family glycosyltransferase
MLSVIIPIYNVEDTIKDSLNSLSEQSRDRKDYEIILVDDGSKDRSVEIASKFDCKIIRQNKEGPASARNRGAKAAKGGILLFIDADCIADSHWIEEMVRPFLEDKDIAGVQGVYKTRQEGLIERFIQAEIEERYQLMKRRPFIDFIGTYSAAYRKDIFLKNGMFDESFIRASGEDTDFSFRLSKNGYKMVMNQKAFVYHRHPKTILEYARQKYWRAYYRNRVYRKNPAKAIKDSYTPQELKLQILLSFLMAIAALSLPVYGIRGFYILFALFLLFLISTIKFIKVAKNIDRNIIPISILMLFLRSTIFIFGILAGSVGEVLKFKRKIA